MSARRPQGLHATVVAIGETGVMIRGASGAGKSALAMALVAAARQAGCFGRLVADDRVLASVANGVLIARPHPAIAGRVERRGQGVVSVEHEAGVVVRCVVELAEPGPAGSDLPPRLPASARPTTICEGLALPLLTLRRDAAAGDGAERVVAFVATLAP